ncbi:MAG: prefoldin subunit alpha [Candidatus Bathyarchaeia archaeon]
MTTADETIRQLYIELRILEDTVRLLRTRLNLLETSILDLRTSGSTLEAMKEIKPGHPALIPIGTSAYIKTKVSEVDRPLINVGMGVFMEKNLEEATKSIGDRLSELEQGSLSIRQQLATATERYEEASRKLSDLVREREEAVRRAEEGR